jgi:hypothetical protein
VFDFLELADDIHESQLEQALIDDIQRLLLELGTGFAFYGRQHPLLVGGREFFLDLLFYHHALRRFVIIDLKIGEFQAEFVSKMNLYLNAVDEQLRVGDDRESGRDHPLHQPQRDHRQARPSPRVRADRGLSTWQAGTTSELPAVEIRDDVPADLDELSELDTVRTRLIERVARHAPELPAGKAGHDERHGSNPRLTDQPPRSLKRIHPLATPGLRAFSEAAEDSCFRERYICSLLSSLSTTSTNVLWARPAARAHLRHRVNRTHC